MSWDEGDGFDGSDDEPSIPDLMHRDIPHTKSGSRGRRVRSPRVLNRNAVGRPKNTIERVKFQTTISEETSDLLEQNKVSVGKLLDAWLTSDEEIKWTKSEELDDPC